jgi:hypothetical protein
MNWQTLQVHANELADAARMASAACDVLAGAILCHRDQPTLQTANRIDVAASRLGEALAEMDRATKVYTNTETNVLGVSALLAPTPEGAAR